MSTRIIILVIKSFQLSSKPLQLSSTHERPTHNEQKVKEE